MKTSSPLVPLTDPVLRAQAETVSLEEITTPAFKKVLKNMSTALSNEKFGVALAAPQIGISKRIFVISGKTLAAHNDEDYAPETCPDLFFINPDVIKASKKQRTSNEGCLSVPGKYGTKVSRADKVSITYQDETGTKKSYNASGFIAQVIQHEIDHLHGILYIDHALEVIDVDENLHPITHSNTDIETMRNERI